VYEGGSCVSVTVPIDELPSFVRVGSELAETLLDGK
jgi:hypothetical protein